MEKSEHFWEFFILKLFSLYIDENLHPENVNQSAMILFVTETYCVKFLLFALLSVLQL